MSGRAYLRTGPGGHDHFQLLEHPSPVPPEGYRWALIAEDPAAAESQRRSKLPKYGDSSSKLRKFRYEPLSHMSKRIRLLKLMAGDQDTSEVECQLFEGEIDDDRIYRVADEGKVKTTELVEYEALSWSWGKGLRDYQVLIRKGEERRQMGASSDLVWALRYLRHADRDRVLWIDALCIDQASVEEKNHQVQMMSQIYSYATRVCIWLGEEDRESKTAINFIKNEILKLEQFDELCQDERNTEKWQALLMLMQRPWFFRRWVVQEIALARDAVIYCGGDIISWKDFSVAVELFVEVETATHRLSEVMKKDPRFYHVPRWFEYVSALGASLLVEATGMIFRYYKPEKPDQGPTAQAKKSPTDAPLAPSSSSAKGSSSQRRSGHDAGSDSDSDGDAIHKKKKKKSPWEEWDVRLDSGDGASQSTKGGLPNEGQGSKTNGKDSADPTPAATTSNGADNTQAQDQGAAEKDGGATAQDLDPVRQRRPLLSLEYLVSRLYIFAATEPRDAIYALLAIANDGYPAAEGPEEDATQTLVRETLIGGQKPFPVDYGRAYADVCQDFIEFCISRSDKKHALDIICRPWAPDPTPGTSIHFQRRPIGPKMKQWIEDVVAAQKEIVAERYKNANTGGKKFDPVVEPLWTKHFPTPAMREFERQKEGDKSSGGAEDVALPSWIPRLDGAPFAMHYQAGVHIMKMGRKNADPLVGAPNSRNYDAAQGMPVDMSTLRFRKRRQHNAHCMFVKGFVLETVDYVAHSSQSGNIPKEWLQTAGWKIRDDPQDDKGPPDEFWRTLVADRGRDERNPPYYYKKACKESVYKGGLPSGAVNTSDLINNERNSIVAQFCRRVQAVIWNRSIIKTDQGNLGVAAKNVKTGDLVCILYGCSVPVILRKRTKSGKEQEEDQEEDKTMQKVEAILRNAMSRYRPKKRRKAAWEKLPEDFPDGLPTENKRKTWTRRQVRGWLEDYNKLRKERLKGKDSTAEKNGEVKQRRDVTREPLVRQEYYYEFLGECYIHGMMDGEAMSRKSNFEDGVMKEWRAKKNLDKEKIEQKARELRQKRVSEMMEKRKSWEAKEKENKAARDKFTKKKEELAATVRLLSEKRGQPSPSLQRSLTMKMMRQHDSDDERDEATDSHLGSVSHDGATGLDALSRKTTLADAGSSVLMSRREKTIAAVADDDAAPDLEDDESQVDEGFGEAMAREATVGGSPENEDGNGSVGSDSTGSGTGRGVAHGPLEGAETGSGENGSDAGEGQRPETAADVTEEDRYLAEADIWNGWREELLCDTIFELR